MQYLYKAIQMRQSQTGFGLGTKCTKGPSLVCIVCGTKHAACTLSHIHEHFQWRSTMYLQEEKRNIDRIPGRAKTKENLPMRTGATRDEHYLCVCFNVADELLVEAQALLGRAVPPHVIPALSRRGRGSPERELWEGTPPLDHC
jgi:hypothetical protein